MSENIGSIDDLLTGSKTKETPETPEHQPEMVEDIQEEDSTPEADDHGDEPSDESAGEGVAEEGRHVDEYGNDTQTKKMYTEDEVNERINKAVRERLERLERNQATPSQQQVNQQAQDNFQYDENSDQSWQQQLEQFVEQTVSKMSQKQAQKAQQAKEQAAQQEFEAKFHQGMSRFSDFVDVVGQQPITDPMTLATRGMKDPAAFLYAASKRHPQELQRISQLPDPYSQMVEMGKLEERMRKTAPQSRAPRPVSRTTGDATIPHKDDKEPSIEDLIAQSNERRLAKRKARFRK